MGDHTYIGETFGFDDFGVYEIININVVDEDIAKGIKFNGRNQKDISRIIGSIGDDERFYAENSSFSENGDGSKKDAFSLEENSTRNRRRSNGDTDSDERVQGLSFLSKVVLPTFYAMMVNEIEGMLERD